LRAKQPPNSKLKNHLAKHRTPCARTTEDGKTGKATIESHSSKSVATSSDAALRVTRETVLKPSQANNSLSNLLRRMLLFQPSQANASLSTFSGECFSFNIDVK
jgi:hypothetical protein